MLMSEVADTDWVHGRPEWWRSTAGKLPTKSHGIFGTIIDEGENAKSVPSQFEWEITPPIDWKIADNKKGGNGWMRQRYKPPARSILLPCSWSIFFLVATIIPLVFPGRTPNDQLAALVLFLLTWSLIFIPAWMAQNEMPRGGGWMIGKNTILFLILGTIVFPLHIIIEPKIGWISYAFFCGAWYSQILRFQDGFRIPSNRWILPFEHSKWSKEILADDWEICSIKWRNGPIAIHSTISGLELHGTSRSGERFIAFHFHGPQGWLNDPFTKQMESSPIQKSLILPPIKSEGEKWNSRFLQKNVKSSESE